MASRKRTIKKHEVAARRTSEARLNKRGLASLAELRDAIAKKKPAPQVESPTSKAKPQPAHAEPLTSRAELQSAERTPREPPNAVATFRELVSAQPLRPAAEIVVRTVSAAAATSRVSLESVPLTLRRVGERYEALAAGVKLAVLRDLTQGRFRPEVTLDAHGLTAVEARRAVDALLRAAAKSGVRTVLIIHGRGLNSGPSGPVLRDTLMQHLVQKHASRLLAMVTAPARLGGEGALLLRLKRAT